MTLRDFISVCTTYNMDYPVLSFLCFPMLRHVIMMSWKLMITAERKQMMKAPLDETLGMTQMMK